MSVLQEKGLVMRRSKVVMLLTVLVCLGCRPTVHEMEGRELEHPAAARAAALAREGDRVGAIALYNRILEEQPDLARFHLELAFMYDVSGGDHVRALYHYQRYLEMRPQTEKRAMIDARIEKARRTLAAAYGHGSDELKARIAELEIENAALRESVAMIGRRMPEADVASTPPATPAAIPAAPTPATRDIRYVVRERDSLSALAQRFYRDPQQWQRIYDANRDRIPNPNVLPVGVTIVIPTVPQGATE